jgi:hypothetical protein
MRRFLLATTALMALAGTAQAQSLQSGSADGMPYVMLPASGGCSAATPCSVVTYLSYMDEAPSDTASDVQNYFGGAFAQANPHTIVIAPEITEQQSTSVNWGGYDGITSPQQAQMIQVVKSIEQSMGATVNPADSVVTGGSLGADGTQSSLIQCGPKGLDPSCKGTFSAGLSFDAATYAAAGNTADIQALCGVPLMAVHGTADTNQSVTYDENLNSQLASCGSFTFVPVQGAGHGTWGGPSGYGAGDGPGTPLAWLSSEISRLAGTASAVVASSTVSTAPATATTKPSTAPAVASAAPSGGTSAAVPTAIAPASAATTQPAAATQPTTTAAAPCTGPATGAFTISNGQIIGPNGQTFIAHGVDLWASSMSDVSATLISLLPGTNMVRVYDANYQDPSTYASFISTLTGKGIVVVIVDAYNGAGNGGGGQGVAFSGQTLMQQQAWFQTFASTYANNFYVWFGPNNEPPGDGLTAWEQESYNTIRSAGNNSIIMLDLPGGGYPGNTIAAYGMDASVYARMTNIVLDPHFYGWVTRGDNSQGAATSAMQEELSAAQLQTANGVAPEIIGEYGNATDGSNIDPNWQQVVNAVTQSGVGSTAWALPGGGGSGDILANGMSLTAFGQMVAEFIVQGAGGVIGAIASATGTAACPLASTPAAVEAGNAAAAIGAATGTVQNAATPLVDTVNPSVIAAIQAAQPIIQQAEQTGAQAAALSNSTPSTSPAASPDVAADTAATLSQADATAQQAQALSNTQQDQDLINQANADLAAAQALLSGVH